MTLLTTDVPRGRRGRSPPLARGGTLLAAVSDVAHPAWRASAVGVYRLWRDGGYALGALSAGLLADLLGASWAIAGIGVVTFLSGGLVLGRMYETLPARQASPGNIRAATVRERPSPLG